MENPYQLRNKLYADLARLTELSNANTNENAMVGVRLNGKDIVMVEKKHLPVLIEALKAQADQALFPKEGDSSS